MRAILKRLQIPIAVICLIPCVLSLGALAQGNNDSELRGDLARLDKLRASGDLNSMQVMIENDSTRWRAKDSDLYVRYMHEACAALSSYDIGDTSQRALLLSKYATAVLTIAELPLAEHVQFVEFLTLDPPVITERFWKDLRMRKARFWLEAWRRIDRAVDAKFDFEDRPVLHVSPPASTGLPTGVPPSAIKDPQLRAQYEKAIAANRTKAERYNEQYWLKLNASRFYEEAERYLVNAYARTPSDSPELKRLLTEYLANSSKRQHVLEKLKNLVQH